MATPKLSPLNRFGVKVSLVADDETPLTVGTVTAFIADSNSPTAVALDESLTVSAVHLGAGIWRVFIPKERLTVATLDAAFGDGQATPYLILDAPGNRVYLQLKYHPSRPAEVQD